MTRNEVKKLMEINRDQQLALLSSYRKAGITPTGSDANTELTDVQSVKLPANPTKAELIAFAESVLNNKDTELKMVDKLTSSGRYDYLESLELQIPTYEYTEEKLERNVRKSVRKIIEKKLGMSTWQTLDCKLFMLFMDGSISWKKLRETVKEDCNV